MSLPRHYRLAPALALFACACGESLSDEAGTTSPIDVVVKDTVAAADLSDTPPVTAPPCFAAGDCEAAFVDLLPCERVECLGTEQGAGSCQRSFRAAGQPCVLSDPCVVAAECTELGECLPVAEVTCPPRDCEVAMGCVAGACAYTAMDAGPCDDHDPCTEGDACVAGVCAPGLPVAGCACGRDADCPGTGDGCAGAPACIAGRCALVPVGGVTCDAPAGSCAANVCAEGVCMAEPLTSGSCTDGNLCTTKDSCTDGACVGVAGEACTCTEDADCAGFEDGDLCNGVLGCVDGACTVLAETRVVCPTPDGPCRAAVCEPSTGLCLEGNRSDGVACADGDLCTLGDRCLEGACQPTVAALCGPPALCDGAPCDSACLKPLSCDSAAGCPSDDEWLLSGTPCDDGDPCHLDDRCLLGRCRPGNVTLTCGDGGPCRTPSCTAGAGCTTMPLEGPCDDGDPCTLGDGCVDGECAPGAPKDCEDDDPCTTGFCTAGVGCSLVNNTALCDDGDVCTSGDRCQAGQCKPGAKTCPCNEDSDCVGNTTGTCLGAWHCIENQCALDTSAATGCAAPGPCRVEQCQFKTGVCAMVVAPEAAPCDDGLDCTAGESCAAGACVGAALVCDDGLPCTADVCAEGTGCSHAPLAVPCDDGNPCTAGDSCKAGYCTGVGVCECKSDADCAQPDSACAARIRCVAGQCAEAPETAVVCPSFGPCVASACDPATAACLLDVRVDGTPCSDGDACTMDDRCTAGDCSGSPRHCDDGSACTHDECGSSGCVSVPFTGPCNDGDPCTANETCTGGACVGTPSLCHEVCEAPGDEDHDGLADCADTDCAIAAACSACALAPALTCGALVSGTLPDDAPSGFGVTACGGGPLGDRVFRFSTSATNSVEVSLVKGADTFTLRVLTTGPGEACELGGCKAAGQTAAFQAVAGATYTVLVEKLFLGAAPDFSLRVDCATPCTPSCGGALCGPNGCGGFCGTCDDGEVCTDEQCVNGACESTPIPGCCKTSDDCSGGIPCAPAYCDQGSCTVVVFPGCCLDDSDCNNTLACASESCIAGACVPDEAPGCCVTAADCADGDACTNEHCVGGQCTFAQRPGCCGTEADCPSPPPCELAACLAGDCITVPVVSTQCCVEVDDCVDAYPCTRDLCLPAGVCAHEPLAGCCVTAADCPAPGGVCAVAACVAGACTVLPSSLCCGVDEDCGGGTCGPRACIDGECVSLAPPAGCCESAADCDDGDSCTDDRCAAGTCAHDHRLGCCSGPFECDDGDSCTLDGCHDGLCRHDGVSGCCSADGDCDDGIGCTVDRCVQGGCAAAPIPGCCSQALDCLVGSCLAANCIGGRCAASPLGVCCTDDAECASAHPCEAGSCVSGICVIEPLAGCCVADADCPTPLDACQRPRCLAGVCTTTPEPGCCTGSCAAGAGCAATSCTGHQCLSAPVDACCADGGPCVDPGIGCNSGTCASGVCSPDPSETSTCCLQAADCGEPAGCVVEGCDDNVCVAAAVPGCCAADEDCASEPHTVCEETRCVLGRCGTVPKGGGCCLVDTDCPAPTGQCAERACVANQCVERPLLGCCSSAADCPAPGPCAVAACVEQRCAVAPVPGCCDDNAACALEHACAAGTCEGRCSVSMPEGCCTTTEDCGQSTDPCLAAACTDGACGLVPVEGCCATDADCGVAADACAAPRCLLGRCVDVGVGGCCAADTDCDEDANPCTRAECSGGSCVFSAIPGCCAVDGDCSSAAPCQTAACNAGVCTSYIAPGCAGGSCLFVGFESGVGGAVLAGGLAIGSAGALGGAADARVVLGPAAVVPATMTTPAFDAGPETRARLAYRLDVPFGDCSAGALRTEVLAADGTVLATPTVHCARSTGRVDVPLTLGAFAGQRIRLRVVITPATGLGAVSAAVDDVAVTGCALPCAGNCDDGDPCTTDVCVAGACVATPSLGCCRVQAECDDGDPCTLDTCKAGSCVHAVVAGCTASGCFAAPLTAGIAHGLDITPGGFIEVTSGSLTPGGHLGLFAGPQHVGQTVSVALPRVATSGSSSLHLAIRKSLGGVCELGRLVVVRNGVETPLGCGSNDWQSVQVALPSAGDHELRLVLTVYQPGASVELDDLSILGACRTVECAVAADCDDGVPCTVDRCGAARSCSHVPVEDCCASALDCVADGPCDAVACSGGRCQHSRVADCPADTCAYWGFDGALAFSGGDVNTAPRDVAHVVVGSPDARLELRHRTAFDAADCAGGALSVWVGGSLELVACGERDWTWLEVPLGAFVGETVTVSARLTAPEGASAPMAWLDEIRVVGRCAAAACREARDCDDGNRCTIDACRGLGCLHVSTTAPCDDGTACTANDRCSSGSCVGEARVCEDGNPCTTESCDSSLGCVFATRTGSCDDGRSCSAGDRCAGGVCRGTPLGCKDFNPCTRDACVEGLGCRFEPEPYGTPCADGLCWDGVCSEWLLGHGAETVTRFTDVAARTTPSPLRLVGAGTSAVTARLDEATVTTSALEVWPAVPGFSALAGGFAIGGDAVVRLDSGVVSTVDVAPGGPLAAGVVLGQNLFVAGEGSAYGRIRSNLHRCKLTSGELSGKCQRMAIVEAAAQCGRQETFHATSLLPFGAQQLLIGGASVEGDDWVARVARWDGNTAASCDALPVHSGRATFEGGLVVNQVSGGTIERVTAMASGPAGPLVVGARGLVASLDSGGLWRLLWPGDFPVARLWSPAFDVSDVAVDAGGAHLVGDGVGLFQGGCRDGFYAHAGYHAADGWVFDVLQPLPLSLRDCTSPPPRSLLDVAAVSVDSLSGDLVVVGQSPLGPLPRGFVLRLRRP